MKSQQQHLFKKLFYLPAKSLLIVTAVAVLFIGSEVSAKASAEDVHEVADLCMYANRALKDYALIGMGVDYHNPKAELEKTLQLTAEHFKDLKSHELNKKLKAEIIELETAWNAMQPEFEKEPAKSKMHDLHVQVEKYTVRCEEIAEDLAKNTAIKGEHYVVLVAALGMESQRMAAEYLTKAWGVTDAGYDEEVKHMVEETEKIFKELLEADEKLVSSEIKEKLKDVEKDFIALGVKLKSTSGRFMPTFAEKSASKIYDKVNDILHMEIKLVEGTVSGYFIPVADEESKSNNLEIIKEIS